MQNLFVVFVEQITNLATEKINEVLVVTFILMLVKLLGLTDNQLQSISSTAVQSL